MFQGKRPSLGTLANQRVPARLDISSMVDVVFLLLLFFIVSTRFNEDPALGIDLPSAQGVDTVAVAPDEVIIAADGIITISGKQVGEGQLEQQFLALFAKQGTEPLTIRADGDARHARIIEVYDLARRSGFTKLNVAVKQE